MDDEIEDIVGSVKYSDSQKSVATRSSLALYSSDFTDLEASSHCSERNVSSSKETYVIECDSDDSDKRPRSCSYLPLSPAAPPSPAPLYQSITMVARETFTQTSKTIIELAQMEGNVKVLGETNNLQTQTSFMSVTEKTVEYKFEVISPNQYAAGELMENKPSVEIEELSEEQCNQLEGIDECAKFPVSVSEPEDIKDNTCRSSDSVRRNDSANDETGQMLDDDSHQDEYRCDYDPGNEFSDKELNLGDEHSSEYDEESLSDIEEDSLMHDSPKNKDVQELRNKICENIEMCLYERYAEPDNDRYVEPDIRRFGTLTPLTEETKKESLMDLVPTKETKEHGDLNDELLFTNDSGLKVKLMKDDKKDDFKLPPIQSCPNSPHVNSLVGKPGLTKAGTLPSLFDKRPNRWEIETKNLASGESHMITGHVMIPEHPPLKSGSPKPLGPIFLPPINGETPNSGKSIAESPKPQTAAPPSDVMSPLHQPISIKTKIKELKQNSANSTPKNYLVTCKMRERCLSPGSSTSPDRRDAHISQLGCESMVQEILRKLRSNSWFDVVDALSDLPGDMERFWSIIPEMRIADLLRQVNVHVESARPQVARAACAAVATILKNTNYTKKPDFYETVTLLLSKTGSYSRLVRRAANVALDTIVCGVDLSHAVTALCVHGVDHKNALVRCASARLLVVSCALGGGGRRLLRARPPSAAAARRLALSALAALLDDRATDARKYAERLYVMLRPLTNFEAYYLTDVDVETASRQMKKYDQILISTQKNPR